MAEVPRDIAMDNFSKGRDFPRSPASISPVSSRRDSLRSKSDKHSAPRDTPSPPMRVTRKRAASLNTDAANLLPHTDNLSLNSARLLAGPQTGGREKVCLCQPDPKIPRPRNAFILYRQHYQSQVVAQHPGLANPEISKIIGEQWRDQPIDVKNEWKRLAEEEKQRHQRQYPDYRYQPRRAGKAGGVRPVTSSSSDDPGRCPKCGGRYISTPSTPLTPYTPIYQAHSGPNNGSRAQSSRVRPATPSYDQQQHQHYQMPSPRTIPLHPSVRQHRPQFSGPQTQIGPLRERDDEMEISSPDFKRRRFNNEPPPQQAPPRTYLPQSPYGQPPQDPRRMVMTGGRPPPYTGWTEDRRPGMPLPSPGQLIHQHAGGMEPPPRPATHMQSYSPHHIQMQPAVVQASRSPTFDESLRLPPLQTSMTPVEPPRISEHSRRDSHNRSVEAMVMTIPYINKIKVLSKISPPLAPPSAGSPVHEVRGAVVAIEGSDEAAITEVGRYIQGCLDKETEIALRCWTASTSIATGGKPDELMTSPTGSINSDLLSCGKNESFIDYFKDILSWHQKSIEIENFITTHPQSHFLADKNVTRTTEPISPSTTATSLASPDLSVSAQLSASSTAGVSSASMNTGSTTPPLSKPRIPVALLSSGFSLTTSDHYASRIPINDAYAPVDHWQWTATLWRGIIGPDMTIYVSSPGAAAKDNNDVAAGGVEMRNDCAAIVVKAEGPDGRVEERSLRRLGFEVLEFVRGFSSSDKI